MLIKVTSGSTQLFSKSTEQLFQRISINMTTDTLPAGGRATEGGMAFQAGVGMWFAAHLLARMPVGGRFGLDVAAYPISLQLETGQGLDDIVVTLSNGGVIAVQCKTRPSLSASETSDLGETVAQAVQFTTAAPAGLSVVDLQQSAAVMAVATNAPATLNSLNESCRMFATGDDWSAVYARVSAAQKSAMDILKAHITASRLAASLPPPVERDLVDFARVFHIERFAVGQGESDWREASNIIGARLFGAEEFGAAPLVSLLTIIRGLIRSGAPANRDGLLRQLRAAGHLDARAPQFDEDIAALRRKTQSELARLRRHAVLPISGEVLIERTCMPALRSAVSTGSFLVVGEPGAGKTGVLVVFAQEQLTVNPATVLISADDLAGVDTDDALRIALGLQHPLIDVLTAWPGGNRGILIIDALDASRGGFAEPVFARVIESVQTRLGDRWSVIAAIRSFDLKNGKRFRRAMAGMPPDERYIDSTASDVRHFRVPALADEELSEVANKEKRLGVLLTSAPNSLKILLRNVFNLSLAAELLEGGAPASSIATLTTQSELIDRYEDERLSSTELQAAVARVVEVMVQRRRLILRKVDVAHPALDDVLRAGVLVATGDRVEFAHHVLFDHAAGRYFLDWNDTSRLALQMSEAEGLGLLLGPSLRFAIERIWRDDSVGRPHSWRLVTDLVATVDLDPIVSSAALRSTTERVSEPQDVGFLCTLVTTPGRAAMMGPILSKLVRFAGLTLAENGRIADSVATAWASLAAAAAEMQLREFADGVRIILQMLFEKADFSSETFLSPFGTGARGLLSLSWSGDPRLASLSGNAIRFVAKSFGSAPVASRALLQQILEPSRFAEHAHEEAPWLAEGVKHIVPHDPDFVVSVYAALYGRSAPSEGDSWMGGVASRILPLRIGRRQEYEHSRWYLEQALPDFLQAFPNKAAQAVNAATIGISRSERSHRQQRPVHEIQAGEQTIRIVDDGLSYSAWRSSEDTSDSRDRPVLSAFVQFISTCEPDKFRQVVSAAIAEDICAASVWARILGIASGRVGVADDMLWPFASSPDVGRIADLVRDWALYVSSAYSTVTIEQRTAFERSLIEDIRTSEAEGSGEHRYRASRLLSLLADELVATVELRELKIELEQAGLLTGNRPILSIGTHRGDAGDFTELYLRSQGANVDEGPDRQVLDSWAVLDTMLKETNAGTDIDSLAGLWTQVRSTVVAIDTLSVSAHEATLHAAWGSIANAVERIADSEYYDPSNSNHPTLVALVELLDRLATSVYPRPRENENPSMSWGNLDVRVYGASSLMALARRFGSSDSTLLDRLELVLGDVEPTVRYQVSTHLNALWDVDRTRMWILMEKVARNETDRALIGYFLNGPLSRVATADVARAESLLDIVIERFPIEHGTDSRSERELEQALGSIVAGLYVGHASARCLAHLRRWLVDIGASSDLLWAAVSTLRAALFLKFTQPESADSEPIQLRASELLGMVVATAAEVMPVALASFNEASDGSVTRVASGNTYSAATKLIWHCVNQLYFGAGAFRNGHQERDVGLESSESKRRFLVEYQTILAGIGQSADPAAIHHLVELYEFISDGDPATVFDLVTGLLVGPAAREGYHFESLALDVVVRIVRSYLADHRELFEDPGRRSTLISVLQLFSEAGWPDALRLLYELPDLMR